MLAKKNAERTGKFIEIDGFSAQINENGGAVALDKDGNNFLLTHENILSFFGNSVNFKMIDENGYDRVEEGSVSEYMGIRGKSFKYTERVKCVYSTNGEPTITTSNAEEVIVDQFGYPFHPDAMNEKQYFTLEGDIITMNDEGKIKQKLDRKLRMPIFLNFGKIRVSLSYQVDCYSIADHEGKSYLFDQSAQLIDGDRVLKHDRVIKGVINKIFSIRQCIEGSYYYEDLINRGREVVTKSLINIDYDKAIKTVSSKSTRKKVSDEERLKYKLENPKEAFAKCEENWVQQALFNEFRRLSWKNSEKEKGGRAVSLTAAARRKAVKVDESGVVVNLFDMMSYCDEKSLANESECEDDGIEEFMGTAESLDLDNNLNDSKQAEIDKDNLLRIIDETEGDINQDHIIKQMIRSLPSNRYEDLQLLIKESLMAPTRNARNARSAEEIEDDMESYEAESDSGSSLDTDNDDFNTDKD